MHFSRSGNVISIEGGPSDCAAFEKITAHVQQLPDLKNTGGAGIFSRKLYIQMRTKESADALEAWLLETFTFTPDAPEEGDEA